MHRVLVRRSRHLRQWSARFAEVSTFVQHKPFVGGNHSLCRRGFEYAGEDMSTSFIVG
jgi:hypothetical protein